MATDANVDPIPIDRRGLEHIPLTKEIRLSVVPETDIQTALACIDGNGDLLAGSVPPTSSLFPFFGQNAQPRPLKSIFRSVRERWGAVAILEHPYMDLDFWDGYSGLYSKCFRRLNVECHRLHFFSSASLRQSPEGYDHGFATMIVQDILDGMPWEAITRKNDTAQPRYHGYSVLRPTGSYVVSRTSIDFDGRTVHGDCADERLPSGPASKLLPEEKNSKAAVLTVRHPRLVHILRTRILCDAPEFLQQDPNLGNCSSASLWVASRSMSREHGVTNYSFATIAKQERGIGPAAWTTHGNYDPDNPVVGNSMTDIALALGQTGWRAIEAPINPAKAAAGEYARLADAAFSYLSSGMPTIFALGYPGSKLRGHAVAAVGYKPADPEQIIAEQQPLQAITNRVPSSLLDGAPTANYMYGPMVRVYYVHDDAFGPYNRLRYALDRGPSKPRMSIGGPPGSTLHLAGLVIAVPACVRMPRSSAIALALRLHLDDDEGSVNKMLLCAKKQGAKPKRDLATVWRTTLISGAEYKARLGDRYFPEKFCSWVGLLHLPEYIWVIEWCLCQPSGKSLNLPVFKVFGEYVLDATAPMHHPYLICKRIGKACYTHPGSSESKFDMADGLPSCSDYKLLQSSLPR